MYELLKNPDEELANFFCLKVLIGNLYHTKYSVLADCGKQGGGGAFKRVGADLNSKEFLTIIILRESWLVYPLSADKNGFGVLIPHIFFISKSMNNISEPQFSDLNEDKIKNWKRIKIS